MGTQVCEKDCFLDCASTLSALLSFKHSALVLILHRHCIPCIPHNFARLLHSDKSSVLWGS
jgi:hypothetical protein